MLLSVGAWRRGMGRARGMGRTRMRVGAWAVLLPGLWCVCLLGVSCRSAPKASPAHPAVSAVPVSSSEPEPPIAVRDARFVVTECPEVRRMDGRAAERAMRKLMEPCVKIPGKAAHFSATLLPSGRIELASPGGEPADGVVPTCVLTSPLTHSVALRQPCTFDVQLAERSVGPSAGQGAVPPE